MARLSAAPGPEGPVARHAVSAAPTLWASDHSRPAAESVDPDKGGYSLALHDDIDSGPTGPAAPAEPDASGRGTTTRRWVKRTVWVVLLMLVVDHLVLPQLGGARKAAHLIDTVNPALLLAAVGLEASALLSYAKLAQATLPEHPHVPLFSLLRIQLATKTVNNLVPAGSAAGSALGYRLLTEGGATSSSAGFTMASVSIGSAVVLNVMLWLALLVSIPLSGFNPLYGTAAIAGLLLLGSFAAVVLLLMKGGQRAEQAVGHMARSLPLIREDTAVRLLRQIAVRIKELAEDRELMRRGVLWASANWLFDAASLWVFLRAFGATVNPIDLLVAFGLANVLAVIPITPGGLGVVEAVLTSTLVGFGLDRGTAAIGVVSYRLAAFWLPIPLGALAYASLKFGPASLRHTRRVHAIRELADEAIELSDHHLWDDAPTAQTGIARGPRQL